MDAANAFARGTDAEKGAALTLQAAANAKLRTQLKELNTELEGVRAELKNVIAEAAAFVEQSEAEVKSLCMQPAVPCCMHKTCLASPLLAFLHLYGQVECKWSITCPQNLNPGLPICRPHGLPQLQRPRRRLSVVCYPMQSSARLIWSTSLKL